MTKFGTIFKSLDGLRVQAATTANVAKSVELTVEAGPVKRAVYSHAATQSLAKSLRSANGEGFWGAVKDQRYDEAVIESLAKAGVEPAQIGAFLNSAHGNQLGVSLSAGMAKTLGISAHVRKTFGQWSTRRPEPVQKTSRPTATERVAKTVTTEPAQAVTPSSIAGFVAKSFGNGKLAKVNVNHATDGKFTTGSNAATRSEGKGAVTETAEFKDKQGVDRVKLRSTVKGEPVTLDMRKDVMDKIRSGELATNPDLAPEKWNAGGENPKREEFDAVNGYQPAAEVAAKYGKDSDAARLNADLGKSIATAWGRIEHASNFDPAEAMHKGLLYKADQILSHAAKDIAPQLEFAKAHDGNLPVPIANLHGADHTENFKAAQKGYPFAIDHTIETDKGVVDVTLRYSHNPGYPATRMEPGAGDEVEHRTFVNEKGHPPFELDTDKVPGLGKSLTEKILNEHDK